MDVHYFIEYCISQNVNSIAQSVQDIQKWQMYQAKKTHPLDIIDEEYNAQQVQFEKDNTQNKLGGKICIGLVPILLLGTIYFAKQYDKEIVALGFGVACFICGLVGGFVTFTNDSFAPKVTYCVYMASTTWDSLGRPERPAKFIAKSRNPNLHQ